VLGGHVAVSKGPLVVDELVELFVPLAVDAVPHKVQLVEHADLAGRELSVLEVVPLALDPSRELLVGIAAEDVRVAVDGVVPDEVFVVPPPGGLDDAHAVGVVFFFWGGCGCGCDCS